MKAVGLDALDLKHQASSLTDTGSKFAGVFVPRPALLSASRESFDYLLSSKYAGIFGFGVTLFDSRLQTISLNLISAFTLPDAPLIQLKFSSPAVTSKIHKSFVGLYPQFAARQKVLAVSLPQAEFKSHCIQFSDRSLCQHTLAQSCCAQANDWGLWSTLARRALPPTRSQISLACELSSRTASDNLWKE